MNFNIASILFLFLQFVLISVVSQIKKKIVIQNVKRQKLIADVFPGLSKRGWGD